MYLALYRKFRPKTFDEVIGQEHITNTLINQVKTGQIGHAYLFTGTRGTGKTSCAKIFAKAINCLNPKKGSPCGECAVCKAIEEANYKLKEDICIALDVACSELYDEEIKKYILKKDKKEYTYQEIVDNYYIPLINTYPIISIEDPLAEDDIEGWIYITNKLKDKVQLVGDDLFVTNNDRLLDGIKSNYANSILIKINQIGTITETLKTIETAKKNGYTTIISHRSGETEDTSIADLAVAVNSLQIKTGSLSRSERIAKYNRLLTIEDELTNHYSKNLVTYLKEKSFK